MTDLSGRVDTLENQMALVNQDLLLRPDQTAYSALISTWNQQFTELSTLSTQMNTMLRTLQALYTNLNKTVLTNQLSASTTTGTLIPIVNGLTGFSGVYGNYVDQLRIFSGTMFSLFTGHTGLPVSGDPPLAHPTGH